MEELKMGKSGKSGWHCEKQRHSMARKGVKTAKHKTDLYGYADIMGITENDVNPEELKMGIEVEFEHTPSRQIARKIALDHLAEIPDYYTRLARMEKEGKLNMVKVK